MEIRLRPLEDGDLDLLFVWEQDPEAIALATFTRADPADRDAFDRHHERIRANPDTVLLAIEADGSFAGTVGSYPMDGQREVTSWVDRSRWGRGIASTALREFLAIERTRPLHARVAAHNVGSAEVLRRAGFVRIGGETSYAAGVGRDVVEHLFQLTDQEAPSPA